jgi:hypothetical protein
MIEFVFSSPNQHCGKLSAERGSELDDDILRVGPRTVPIVHRDHHAFVDRLFSRKKPLVK